MTKKRSKPVTISPTEKKVVELVVQTLLVDETEVTMGAKIQEDLGADSVDLVEIMMDCEELFGVSITEEDFKDTLDVQDLIELIEKKEKEVNATVVS